MENVRQVIPYECLWIWFTDDGQIVNAETVTPLDRLLPKVEETPHASFSPSNSCHRPPPTCPFSLKSLILLDLIKTHLHLTVPLPHQISFLFPSSPWMFHPHTSSQLVWATHSDTNPCLIQPSSKILAVAAFQIACVCVCIIWLFAYSCLPNPESLSLDH